MNLATTLIVLCIASVGLALPIEEKQARYGLAKRQNAIDEERIEATWASCGKKCSVTLMYTPEKILNADYEVPCDIIQANTGSKEEETTITVLADQRDATSEIISWSCSEGTEYRAVCTDNLGNTVADNIGPGTSALACQDPHLMTFDGYRYNYHGYCSYTLMKSCDDVIYPSFEVTADFRAKDPNHPHSPPTFIVAFEVTSNGKQLIRVNEDDSILIEGKPLATSAAVIGANQGSVKQKNGEVTIRLDSLGFTLDWVRRRHGVDIVLDDSSLKGKICGLLGNADGDPKNDFIKPDGKRTSIPEEFGKSWEIPGSCP